MSYVEGFVIPVPKAHKETYRKLATDMAPMFKKYGAVSVCECWGEDVPDGAVTSFPRAVNCADDETVVFSWIVWPDKETRDSGNKRVMADAEAAGMGPDDMPFDGKRMIFAGFEPLVDA